MSGFELKNGRELALTIARREAALKAQEIRSEAVQNAPVDTGRLRQSLAVEKVDDDTWHVGTNVEYAAFVEYGTRNTPAQPFLRPAVEKVRRG